MRNRTILSLMIFAISLVLGFRGLAQDVIIELNQSTIAGQVAVAGPAETVLSRVYVSASGGNDFGSQSTNIYPNPPSNSANYQLTVNVPAGGSASYSVAAAAYMDSNRDRIQFRPIQGMPGDGAPAANVDFGLDDPGFVERIVSITGVRSRQRN
jgi:hypothetical protein